MRFWNRLRMMHGRVDLMDNGENAFQNLTWKRFVKNKIAVASICLLILILAISFLVPVFVPISYSDVDLTIALQAPSAKHWLGTDEFGRDVLIRLIYGGRISMSVALVAVFLQVLIGTVIGAISGYFGGIVDSTLMRITDVFMCFPFYVMAVALASILGAGVQNAIIIIGFLSWPGLARMVRAQILSVKANDYIMAARALGLPTWQIIFRHIMPNVISPILVSATLSIAGSIMSEASLSFLGMGVEVPQPSWGNMLSAAQNMKALNNEWWRWMPPGLMIVLVVMAVNYIGEGIQKAIDPKEGV